MRSSLLLVLLAGLVGCVSDAPAMPDGGGGDSGPPQDSPAGDQTSSTDVNGKVIDELGFPAPNVKLSIASATTTTAADGTFKLSAPPTYDVALAYDSGTTTTNKRMQAFLGLTTRTPTLQIIQQIKRSGTATVSNTNLTVANGERVGFLIAPTSNSSQTNEFLGPLNFATGMLSLFWNQETPLVGKVYALHYKTPAMSPTDNPIPTSFLHADAQSFPSLADKGNVALSTWSFASGVTVMMNVTINYNGATGKGLSLLYRPDPRGAFSFDDLAFTGQTNATYAIPGGPVYKTGVIVGGTKPSGSSVSAWTLGVAPANPTATVNFPTDDITAMAPADAATGVDPSTQFSWSAVPNAGYVLRLICPGTGAPAQQAVDVLTAQTTAHLPDTSGLGVTLPSMTACKWIVIAFPNIKSTDDLAGAGGWQAFTDVFRSANNTWTLLTKPRAITTK